MKQLLATALLLPFLLSCNQDEINRLRETNQKLTNQIESKDHVIDSLENLELLLRREIRSLTGELSAKKRTLETLEYSDDNIIQAFYNEVKFYCDDKVFRNYNVRKISENVYDIKFEYTDNIVSNFSSRWREGLFRMQISPINENEFEYSIHSRGINLMCYK